MWRNFYKFVVRNNFDQWDCRPLNTYIIDMDVKAFNTFKLGLQYEHNVWVSYRFN